MKVRGITVLTRKVLVTRQFGADAWASFYGDLARSHRCFQSFITPNSLIPLSTFLAFHDELMRRFYGNTDPSHFELGRQVSRFALNEGPFGWFKEKQDLAGLVDSLPMFHQAYFVDAATRSEASLRDEGVEFKVLQAPQKHPYFEQLIIGYISSVLEMYCANPIRVVRLRAGSERDCACLFRASDGGERQRGGQRLSDERGSPPFQAAAWRLSNRELDVLRLIARGKTNKEIGAALGISGKTAQHHVARAYRKIGVSCRVDAALWLSERGIVDR